MPGLLRACLLSLLLLPWSPEWRPGGVLPALEAAPALAQARSSGGYARPRSGYSRTPSFGGPRVAPRTPSRSGGYGVPSTGYPRRPPVTAPGSSSGWDRGYSRERSAEALNRMRRQQDTARQPPALPAPNPAPDPGWWRRGATPGGGGGGYPGGSTGGRNGGWYGDRGWSPGGLPGGLPGMGRRSFGLWDGLFLGFLLNNLGRLGSIDFFHNHQDDPGYREWRAEAERQARDNADLRQRLDELDRQLAERRDQPRDPNYLPPDVPPEVAMAPRADARTPTTGQEAEGGASPLTWLLILGIAGFGFLAWRRRQAAQAAPGAVPGPVGAPPPTDFSAAPRFRVGMTVTCDPTPFLLGGAALKTPPPGGVAGGGRVSIQAVGRIREGAQELTRLYLPDGRGMLQLHLDARAAIDECRYFGIIDEVTPADAAEWAVWLDPQQGLIGWPEFQTKDGRLHGRVWAPGTTPVPPREMVEAIEGLHGTREVRHQAMLYAAPTGIAAPGPETEYILVSALEEGGRAWVEIRAGIDINPASLGLI